MKRSFISKIAAGAAIAALLAISAAGTAHADDRGWRGQRNVVHEDRDWREHEVHVRHWHEHPVGPVVYSPPVLVAPPPPPPESSGINLIVPLNFR